MASTSAFSSASSRPPSWQPVMKALHSRFILFEGMDFHRIRAMHGQSIGFSCLYPELDGLRLPARVAGLLLVDFAPVFFVRRLGVTSFARLALASTVKR
jgi:hypothetical protein